MSEEKKKPYSYWDKASKRKKTLIIVGSLVLALSLWGRTLGDSDDEGSISSSGSGYSAEIEARNQIPGEDPGEELSAPDADLATIQQGHRVDDTDDSTYREISRLLNRLEPVCTANSRTKLADMTANLIMHLDEEYNVDLTPTQVLEDAATASDVWDDADCLNLFASLGLLYKNGMD